eukprot:TRINITY_DN17594_c0_g1_i2.p1 TRINITY_DN17594_c0_g1~~TRINITY_DN17594_c0_g1_i2.p1  ORF type:complete len:369 (-),score=127.83 TRINITY_DN17594_c0_g1_i2:117-1223(-)
MQKKKEEEWTKASEVAVRSGLGLQAVEEKKRKEEEDRQAKREAARARRKGEVAKQEQEDVQAFADCEEQAYFDSENHERVKYEAALIVRLALRYGASNVWMKIAEARARGAAIPLDSRKVYLLAHPDKCPLPEATDATAILSSQRPPELTESSSKVASGESSREAVAARLAAKSTAAAEERRVDPDDGQLCTFAELMQKYSDTYTEEELTDYWKLDCKPADASSTTAVAAGKPDANAHPAPPRQPPAAQTEPEEANAGMTKAAEPFVPKRNAAPAPAPAPAPSRQEAAPAPAPKAATKPPEAVVEEPGDAHAQKADPEDGQLLTYAELKKKYEGMYSATELKAYWTDDCQVPAPAAASKAFSNKSRKY